MSRPLPKPEAYRLHDEGRLVIRCLGSKCYKGMRLPEFESVPGRDAYAVIQNYEGRVLTESMRKLRRP